MSKTVVIHQPDFLPYLGFFHRFLHADLWVVFDHVQFLNNSKSWHNRDKIKTPSGEKWLTVAVQKCPQKTPINEVLLSDTQDWRSDNLNLIRQNYSKAVYFKEIFPHIEKLYSLKVDRMIEFNLASIDMIMEMLDIKIDRVYSSSMSPQGFKNELLLDILKKTNGSRYLTGTGSKNYLDFELFREHKIEVVIQEFKHPVYPQLWGDFVPFLTTVDMLFNCGINDSRMIIRKV